LATFKGIFVPPLPSLCDTSPAAISASKLCRSRQPFDEEFIILDSALAALKIEHEVFFDNPIKRPPADLKWKVLSLLRKFSDDSKMTFSQSYRYYLMVQRYAIYGDLWRIREEG